MIIFLCYLFSVFEYQEIGGGSSATLLSSINNSPYLATATNPALLTLLDKNGLGVVYCQPYEISQIQYHRLSVNYKHFGLSFARFGQTNYQEFNFALSTGLNFNANLCYGLMVKGFYLDLGDYVQSFMPAVNVGLVYQLDKIKIGSVLANLNNPHNKVGDEVAWQISAGATYEPVSDLLLGIDIQKNYQYENFAFGIELKPLAMFVIRFGTQTNPLLISGGIGILYKNIFLDYALKFHPQLQQTSIFSLGYFW
ncbi:MAG: hypothetical protein N2748_00200 [candidate division WOR-3 bacterium]|nr:hypothetical protein [candidate division WOR-3 bacterium]